MPRRRRDLFTDLIASAVWVPLVLLPLGCGGSGTTRVLYAVDVYGTEEDDTADEVYIDDAITDPGYPQEEPWPAEGDDPWTDESGWGDYEDDFDDFDDWDY